MTELEMKIEALIRCVPADVYERELADVKRLAGPEMTDSNVDQLILEIITELGVPANAKGHRYLMDAIHMAVDDLSTLESVRERLYRAVGEMHGVTIAAVEIGMRKAIERAWIRGDSDTKYKYFGNTIDARKGKPTSSEFIAMVSCVVRRRAR